MPEALLIPLAGIMMPVFILFGIFSFVIKMKEMKQKEDRAKYGNQTQFDELSRRLTRIEQRLANLETIVLENEKKRDFERL